MIITLLHKNIKQWQTLLISLNYNTNIYGCLNVFQMLNHWAFTLAENNQSNPSKLLFSWQRLAYKRFSWQDKEAVSKAHEELKFIWSSIYCEPSHSETLKTPGRELHVCKWKQHHTSLWNTKRMFSFYYITSYIAILVLFQLIMQPYSFLLYSVSESSLVDERELNACLKLADRYLPFSRFAIPTLKIFKIGVREPGMSFPKQNAPVITEVCQWRWK